MNPLQTAGAAGIIFMLGLSAGWLSHGWKYDADQLEAANKLAVAVAENDRLKIELGVKHEEERKKIADLAATLAAGRVRLPKGCFQPDSSSGGASATPGTGTLPASPQGAFDRFNGGVAELAREADELMATCRVVVDWAKKQG